MNNEKSDYWQGLLFFSCFMICLCLFFKTPDGDHLFYKFLGLFGISPGIRLGNNSTLYVYMIIPLIMAILCARQVLKYWWHYGLRFKEYHVLLRYFPTFIFILVCLFSANIDRMFYGVIGQRGGLQSVVYYTADNNHLSYKFTGDVSTYSYDLTFKNCSNETVEFNVKFNNIREFDNGDLPEVFIKEDNGNAKLFTLLPKQTTNYKGTFTEYYQTEASSGSGSYIAPIILVNEQEQYIPKPIIK